MLQTYTHFCFPANFSVIFFLIYGKLTTFVPIILSCVSQKAQKWLTRITRIACPTVNCLAELAESAEY